VKHTIFRESPKGEEFRGMCPLCGKQNLRIADVGSDCQYIGELTPEQELLEATRLDEE